jgi:hypothetical protein
VPFARPEPRLPRPGSVDEQERSVPPPRGVWNGTNGHAQLDGNEHHAPHSPRSHPQPEARGPTRDESRETRGNGHGYGSPRGERPERWPGADGEELIPRPDVRGAVGELIDDLRGVFQRDRTTASGLGSSRCGVCYLHFPLDELEYREAEGFYVCPNCARALGSQRLPMVRRQKHM